MYPCEMRDCPIITDHSGNNKIYKLLILLYEIA